MDRNSPIERYRLPLLDIVAELFVMIGLTEGVTIERLSKPLYRLVLGRLRTAESAVRRLIIAAARDIVVEPEPKRPARATRKSSGENKDKGQGAGNQEGKAKRKRGMLFKLFDPPRRFKKLYGRWPKRPKVEPRITVLDVGPDPLIPLFLVFRQPEPAAPAPAPEVEETLDDDTVDARHLIRRLFAITDALQDIPRHAMRLARWQARPIEERRPERSSPLRPGRPPGFRQRAKHEVDEILKECHWLARNVEPQLDTS